VVEDTGRSAISGRRDLGLHLAEAATNVVEYKLRTFESIENVLIRRPDEAVGAHRRDLDLDSLVHVVDIRYVLERIFGGEGPEVMVEGAASLHPVHLDHPD
jgi:hypothetical protein